MRPNHEKLLSTTHRLGSTTKPRASSLRLTISSRRAGNLATASLTWRGVIAAVGPDKFEPGEARAYGVEHEGGAVPILNAGRVNDDPQRQALDVDQRVDLAALDLLAGVVAYAAVLTTPFSADFTDWLSMIAAVGLAWRPIRSRNAMWRRSHIACQTPSR